MAMLRLDISFFSSVRKASSLGRSAFSETPRFTPVQETRVRAMQAVPVSNNDFLITMLKCGSPFSGGYLSHQIRVAEVLICSYTLQLTIVGAAFLPRLLCSLPSWERHSCGDCSHRMTG